MSTFKHETSAHSSHSPSPEVATIMTPPQPRSSPSLPTDTSLISPSPDTDPAEAKAPGEISPAGSPSPSSSAGPQSSTMPTSPPSAHPPPLRLPNSAELAYLGALPTPTVQLVNDPRYGCASHSIYSSVTGTYTQSSETTSQTPSLGVTTVPPSTYPADSAAHAQPGPTNRPDAQPLPPYYDAYPSSFLPNDAILSSASRDWEGATNQGVRVLRRDTWIIGQSWGRHLRVLEGTGDPRGRPHDSRKASDEGPPSAGAEGYYGEGRIPGVERHQTW